jgi:hypothetical protein
MSRPAFLNSTSACATKARSTQKRECRVLCVGAVPPQYDKDCVRLEWAAVHDRGRACLICSFAALMTQTWQLEMPMWCVRRYHACVAAALACFQGLGVFLHNRSGLPVMSAAHNSRMVTSSNCADRETHLLCLSACVCTCPLLLLLCLPRSDVLFAKGLLRVQQYLAGGRDNTTCPICLGGIRPTEAIWACGKSCFALFHMPCIQVKGFLNKSCQAVFSTASVLQCHIRCKQPT